MHPKTIDTGVLNEYLNTFALVSADGSSSASRVQTLITRPANTTTYPSGSVIGGPISFPAIGAIGGHIMITSADLRIDIPAIPVGMGAFRLHMYSVTPPSAYANAAVWDLPATDRAGYLGFIDVTAPIDFGSTLFTQSDNSLNKHVQLDPASTAVFGYIVTSGSYTPASASEVYAPTIRAVAI